MNLREPLQKFPTAESDVSHSNPSSQVFPAPTHGAHTRTFLRAWTHRGCDPMLQCVLSMVQQSAKWIEFYIHTASFTHILHSFWGQTCSCSFLITLVESWVQILLFLNLFIIIMNEAPSCQIFSILLVFVWHINWQTKYGVKRPFVINMMQLEIHVHMSVLL